MSNVPFVEAGDLRVHYALTGRIDVSVLVLSNSLGTNFSMWDTQLPALEKEFRVLRYDTRGHGETAAPPGPYSLEQLAGDVVRLLDALGIDRVHFCGLSLGGMIGMWLGLHQAKRLRKLVLANTAARIGTRESWTARMEQAQTGGMKTIAATVIQRWFTAEFRTRSAQAVASAQRMIENTPPGGYAGCCAAIRDTDLCEAISAISVPTLVIAGAKDPATLAADGRFLRDQIPGAQYQELETAHLSNLEAPGPFASAVIRFLTS
jgi:3-oxoadipate enol-lactonase